VAAATTFRPADTGWTTIIGSDLGDGKSGDGASG
jgi:hypothetical protein